MVLNNPLTNDVTSDKEETGSRRDRWQEVLMNLLDERIERDQKEMMRKEKKQGTKEKKQKNGKKEKNKKDQGKKNLSKIRKTKKKDKKEEGDCSTDNDFKYWFSVGYVDYHLTKTAKKKAEPKRKSKKKKTKKSKSLRGVTGTSKAKKAIVKDPILEAARAEVEAAEDPSNDNDFTETTANSSLDSSHQWSISFPTIRKVNEDEPSDLSSDHTRVSFKEYSCDQDVSPRQPKRGLEKKMYSLPILLSHDSDHNSEGSSDIDLFSDVYRDESTSEQIDDDLADTLENSDRYIRYKAKRPTRWDSFSSESSTINSDCHLPLKTPKRTASKSPSRHHSERENPKPLSDKTVLAKNSRKLEEVKTFRTAYGEQNQASEGTKLIGSKSELSGDLQVIRRTIVYPSLEAATL